MKHLTVVGLLMALVAPVMAQDTTSTRISTVAAQQMVQWWDRASALNFPDTLVSCVYGNRDTAVLRIDSIVVVDGLCPPTQFVGLLGFLDGAQLTTDDWLLWYGRFHRVLAELPMLQLAGSVYGTRIEGDAVFASIQPKYLWVVRRFSNTLEDK